MSHQAQHLKVFAFLFLVLLAVPLVSAISPHVQAGGDYFAEGFVIKYPSDVNFIQNSDYTFNFHVFNLSTGFPLTNKTVSCYFHLYNQSGNHIVASQIPGYSFDHNFDFEIMVKGGNFSTVGRYSYIIQCNSTNFGGFDNVPLSVTSNGKEIPSGNLIIFFTILFLILIAGLLTLLIYDLTRFSTLDFDVRDIVFNLSAYFVLFGTYMLEKEYLANANIERFLSMLVIAGIYPFVYLSIIMFTVCFIFNLMKIRKENRRLK